MPAYFDTGFSVREPMWHGLGTVLNDYPADWAEARKIAGLEWEPETRPLIEIRCTDCGRVWDTAEVEVGACSACLSTAYALSTVEGNRRVIRNDSGLHLGTVTDQWSAVTHDTMGQVLEALAAAGGTVKFETAGSVREGRNVYALAYLDEPVRIAGDDSDSYPFLALLNDHTGAGAFKVLPTTIRVVCWNTYNAADMQGEKHGRQFVFRHVGNVMDRIEEAKEAIAGIREAHAEWVSMAEHLAGFAVDAAALRNFAFQFIPEPPADVTSERVKENVATARSVFTNLYLEQPTTDGHRGTALGLVDAAVEYLDHVRKFKSRESLMNRTLLRGEPLKAKAVDLALEVVGA